LIRSVLLSKQILQPGDDDITSKLIVAFDEWVLKKTTGYRAVMPGVFVLRAIHFIINS